MKANTLSGQPRHPLMRWFPMLALLALLMISPTMAQEPETSNPAQNLELALEKHLGASFPELTLVSVKQEGDTLHIALSGQPTELDGLYTKELFHEIDEAATSFIAQQETVIYDLQLNGEPLETLLEPVPDIEPAPVADEDGTSERSALRGRLSGRKIAISPGHGLYYNGWSWRWQRSDYWGIREDLVTPDIAKYLNDYLRAEGATVYSTRELNKSAGTGESRSPKWQEAARYYIKSQGAPASIWDSSSLDLYDDINARPRYANWKNADILVNLHTNGGGGTGTETWYDTRNGQQTNSLRLATNIQNNVVNIIRNNYNRNWANRRVKGSNGGYGENRLATRPAVIVEAAFHDRQAPDNAALKDERFKKLVAQGVCNGILAYFGQSGTCGGDGGGGGGGGEISNNLALGRPAYASSREDSRYPATRGNDGNGSTRWSSRVSNNLGRQWWYTDLGRQQQFNQITIRWEHAYAASYQIIWYDRGWRFSQRYNISSGQSQTHNIGSRNARYVGVYMLNRAPHMRNYSFWEFEVNQSNRRGTQEREEGVLETSPKGMLDIPLPFDDPMIEKLPESTQ